MTWDWIAESVMGGSGYRQLRRRTGAAMICDIGLTPANGDPLTTLTFNEEIRRPKSENYGAHIRDPASRFIIGYGMQRGRVSFVAAVLMKCVTDTTAKWQRLRHGH